jgi:hypothetical protein
MADLYAGKHIPGTPAAAAAVASSAPIRAGTQQQAAKQQQQQLPQQQQAPSRPAAVVAASTAGTATPAAAAAPVAAVVAAVAAAARDEAACGVQTPPQRSCDNDAPDSSSSSQQPDAGGSPSSVDAAAAVVTTAQGLEEEGLGVSLQDVSPGKLQQHQQQLLLGDNAAAAVAEADDTDRRDEGVAQAAENSESAAAVAIEDVLQDSEAADLLDPALTADSAELPAGVVYAPVLDRSTWVSCASSSFCPTETGSIDGSAFALSEASLPVCSSANAAGYGFDSTEGVAVTPKQQQQGFGSPCSSPSGLGRSRFAAKLERLKESVKESVSIGGGSGSSGSGSGGAAWKLPRAWVQQLRHGHEKDREKDHHQQQQQVSDIELDQEQQQGRVVDHAVGNEGGQCSVGATGSEQQQGKACGVVSTAASLTAAASH